MLRFLILLSVLLVVLYFTYERSRFRLQKEIECGDLKICWYEELGWAENYNTVVAVKKGDGEIILKGIRMGLVDVNCVNDTIRLKVYRHLYEYILLKHVFGHPVIVDTTATYYERLRYYQPSEYERARKHPTFDSLYDPAPLHKK